MLDITPPPYKEYPRFKSIALPEPIISAAPFKELIEKRISSEKFENAALSLQNLSNILHVTAGVNQRRKTPSPARFHPSGGSLYPLEYYVAVFRVDDLERRIYHYNVVNHALEELEGSGSSDTISTALTDMATTLDPAAIVIVTAMWGRLYPKYGELAYRLALTESGHSVQNLLLDAVADEIAVRPVMSFEQDKVSAALDIAADAEDALYMVLLGR